MSSGGWLQGYSPRTIDGADSASTTTRAPLPTLTLGTGFVLHVHLGSSSGCTETSSPTECRASSNAADSYSDSAWDLSATDSLGVSGLDTGAGLIALDDAASRRNDAGTSLNLVGSGRRPVRTRRTGPLAWAERFVHPGEIDHCSPGSFILSGNTRSPTARSGTTTAREIPKSST